MRSGAESARDDRVLYWPVVVTVVCALVCILGWTYLFAGSVFLVPIAILFGVCMAIRAAVVCIEGFIDRAWCRFLSTLILPLAVLVAGFNFNFAWGAGRTAGNYVHLLALYPSYKAEIAGLPTDKPRFKVWEWVDSAPCATGLAYDESDETGRPSGTWAEPFENWTMRTEVAGVPVYGGFGAFHHFYFVVICPPSDRSLKRVF